MRYSIFASLVLCALTNITGCATHQNKVADSLSDQIPVAQKNEVILVPPLQFGKLSLKVKVDYKNPNAGTGYEYGGDIALNADVYIYPSPDEFPKVEIAGTVLNGPMAAVIGELKLAQQHGIYSSVYFKQLSGISLENSQIGVIDAQRLTLSLVRNNRKMHSSAYTALVKNHIVKIRVSHIKYPGLQDNMDWFAANILSRLRYVLYDDGEFVIFIPPVSEDPSNTEIKNVIAILKPAVTVEVRLDAMKKATVTCPDMPARPYVLKVTCFDDFEAITKNEQ